MRYWLAINGETFGPYTLPEITSLLQEGRVSAEDLAAADGTEDWVPLSSLVPGVQPPATQSLPQSLGRHDSLAPRSPLASQGPTGFQPGTPVVSQPKSFSPVVLSLCGALAVILLVLFLARDAISEAFKSEESPAAKARAAADEAAKARAAELESLLSEIRNTGGDVRMEPFLINLSPTKVEQSLAGRLSAFPELQHLNLDSKVTDADLAQLTGLTRLETLSIGFTVRWDSSSLENDAAGGGGPPARPAATYEPGPKVSAVTDAGMAPLGMMQGLKELRIIAPVTDQGTARLKSLAQLEHLVLQSPKLTDRTLETVATLGYLQHLELGEAAWDYSQGPGNPVRIISPISDAGLAELANLRGLKTLVLRHTKVTDEGVERLKGFLPDCEIRVEGK